MINVRNDVLTNDGWSFTIDIYGNSLDRVRKAAESLGIGEEQLLQIAIQHYVDDMGD